MQLNATMHPRERKSHSIYVSHVHGNARLHSATTAIRPRGVKSDPPLRNLRSPKRGPGSRNAGGVAASHDCVRRLLTPAA